MAEDIHVAQTADASGLADLPMRDEDGEIRPQFVEEISREIHAADTASLRAVVTELHQADLGDLIAALAPEDRVGVGGTDGRGFRLLGAERSRRYRHTSGPASPRDTRPATSGDR
jgi:magnesium transporter